jgi:hypothetical protein
MYTSLRGAPATWQTSLTKFSEATINKFDNLATNFYEQELIIIALYLSRVMDKIYM